ncbi:CBS domain-containing protein [Halolamina sp.]|jgi:CBS domain-containing protein|uniref:CBS domain-containing protein n=1 Tax=Halolamina sp. TaxID=1940283 RepID=UPI000223B791|nr:putative transcriptional regulator, XRE family [halophilic archaeon DL31]
MKAADVMTTDVETVSPDDDVSKVLGRLAKVPYSGFPVVEDGDVVGIITEGDLVDLFEVEDRVLWIPIGLPPFVDTLTYAVDVSWDNLDLGLDLAAHADDPIRDLMTIDVETVGPDASLDDLLVLLANRDEDINRVPVLEDGALVGIITRQDLLRGLKAERVAGASGIDA